MRVFLLPITLIIDCVRHNGGNKPELEQEIPNDVRINMVNNEDAVWGPEKAPSVFSKFKSKSEQTAAAAKHSCYWIRRALHQAKDFIFQSDETLEQGYNPQYRYWPIVSGLVVPFSILLEIPGLTEHWYVRTYGTQVIEYRDNPAWLDVGLALSMVSAVAANLCLIIRFLERRIRSATIAAICFLLFHDATNIIALSIFGVAHRQNDGFTYSQAYWATFASTITSLVVTTTLVIDYWRTPDFANAGSGLTRKQRSLVIIVMIMLSYFGVGALVNCFLLDQNFLDSLYFVCCSALTIGFGDITPNSTGSQIFCIFFNAFGILNAGVTIAIARETIVESFERSYRNRMHALSVRRNLHRTSHMQHQPTKVDSTSRFGEIASTAATVIPHTLSNPIPSVENKELPGSNTALNDEGTHEECNKISSKKGKGKDISRAVDGERENVQNEINGPEVNYFRTREEEEEKYIRFRQNMLKEEKKEFRAKLIVSWCLFAVFWTLGGIIFMATEGWSYGTAFYFCFVAFSTIGYGDIAPRTESGRLCFIFWSLLGVGTMTILFSVLSEAYQSRYSTAIHNDLFDKAIRNYEAKTRFNANSTSPRETEAFQSLGQLSVQERRDVLEENKLELTSIPPKLITQARVFHAHLQYALIRNSAQEKPPPGLQRALDELIAEEGMNEGMKKEVLQDEEARRALFMMSFERTLKKMVEAAERASKLIEQRDALEEQLGINDYEDELEDDEEKEMTEALREDDLDRVVEDELDEERSRNF